jgi:PKHD-type hydroxylase|tara:strand:+ start:611 stop:1210 length:600 start_codon:yes stop_codon:yes gene_type:complete
LEFIEKIPKDWNNNCDFETERYFVFTPLFSKEECDNIINIGENLPISDASVTDNREIDKKIRTSRVSWIPTNSDTNWIYNWIWNSVQNTNKWKLDIRGFHDGLQYTVYDGTEKSFYDWHTDTGPGMNHRKISLSIQLSEPDEYSGGTIELERVGMLDSPDVLEKGHAIMFPSIMKHRVLPVTNGIRKSLVVWITGPHIR